MAVAQLLVCEVTRQRLGDDGLAELATCLWAVDCQSCGRLLGADPPSVCIDDLAGVVVASLHHHRCRPPGWDESMTAIAGAGQYTTFVARLILFQAGTTGDPRQQWPLMVVNTGLECALLERADSDRWQVSADLRLAHAGLLRPGPRPPIGRAVGGLVARVTDSSVAVVLQAPPFTVFEAPADERVLDAARRLGGVMLAVTPVLNPGDLTAGELAAALADHKTLVGWVGLHGIRPRQRRGFRLRPEIWVLHWTMTQLAVGRLAGRASKRLSADKARSWAERVISPRLGGPLAWQPAHEGRPDEGWHACDPSSGWQYVLRRHAGGWDLVLSYGQDAGDKAETDNEAKAWAAGVLMLQARVSGVTWWDGYSTEGSVTLYGSA